MSVLYCGIDEAGYGPMLGPLVVGMALFEVRGWEEGDPAPDLWALLSQAVGKSVREAGERIPIGDSKKLKLPNDTRKHHPCVHLERAVLAGLATRDEVARDDASLLGYLGEAVPEPAWYRGEPVSLPLEGGAERARIDANMLASAFERAGVSLAGLRVKLVPEAAFNDVIRATGSKAETTAGPVAELLREAADASDGPVRVICDRQSGRLDYEDIVAKAFPGEGVELDARTSRASRYLVRGGRVALHFETEAEDKHLPAALASMTAKLVRELMMTRFNRHFCALKRDLRPTAGYVQDARRWLGDTRDLLSDGQREALIRIA
ncbi:MAG: hypothetical protein H6810_11690 [Phycisphaeraceae bacterium]|nr:MAG: hypothetical protein H6810_11690 [Phycisphaeraceae bacterium]